MRHATPRNAIARRGGFTLVEMLVVIAIIAILISLGTAAIMKTRVVQQNNNTITLVTKTDQAFQKQWLHIIDTAKTEALDPTSMNLAGYGTPVYDTRRARVIHIKLALMREFPVSFAEITNPGPLGAKPAYVLALANVQPGRSWADESSACLYLALKQGRRGGDSDPDTFLSAQEVANPFNDGIKEIVDAWNQPLILSRFPGYAPAQTTALLGVVPAPAPGNPVDPVDPENLLSNTNWINTPYPPNTTITCGAAFQAVIGYPPGTANSVANMAPVIYSTGYGQGFSPIYNFQVGKR